MIFPFVSLLITAVICSVNAQTEGTACCLDASGTRCGYCATPTSLLGMTCTGQWGAANQGCGGLQCCWNPTNPGLVTTTPFNPYQTTPYNPYGTTPYNPYGTTPYNPYGTTPYNPYGTTPYNPYGTTPYNPYGTTPYNPYGTTPFPGQLTCAGRLRDASISGFAFSQSGFSSSDSMFQIRNEANNSNIFGKSSRMKRIVGGENVQQDGNYCYQAAILQNGQVIATGALIADNFVLTTATAMIRVQSQDPTLQSVRVILGGKVNVNQQITGGTNLGFQIQRIIQNAQFNPRFNVGYPVNDAALLQLNLAGAPLDTTIVCKICMPPNPQPEFRRYFVTGYGSQAENIQVSDGILRRINLSFIPRPVCDMVFRSIFPNRNFALDANSICAGGDQGRDTCNKDGGAPLVGEDVYNNRYLLGLSSWGYGCARYGFPGVYTNVSSLQPWIMSITPVMTNTGPTGG